MSYECHLRHLDILFLFGFNNADIPTKLKKCALKVKLNTFFRIAICSPFIRFLTTEARVRVKQTRWERFEGVLKSLVVCSAHGGAAARSVRRLCLWRKDTCMRPQLVRTADFFHSSVLSTRSRGETGTGFWNRKRWF